MEVTPEAWKLAVADTAAGTGADSKGAAAAGGGGGAAGTAAAGAGAAAGTE